MFVIIADFKIVPDKVEDFAKIIDKQAMDSLIHEEGCHYFDVCQDEADASRFVLYEIYTNAAAYQAHRDYPHSKTFQAAIKQMVQEVKVHRLNRREPRP